MTYKIVSDSSSNLFDLSTTPYQTVPLKIKIGQQQFVDQKGTDVYQMIEILASTNEKSTTSCPSIGEWLEAFQAYPELYVITISSNLSGSYNSACQAKQQYLEEHPDAKILVIDSLSTGAGMQLAIAKIVELKEKGVDFETVERKLADYLKKVELLFNLQSVKNLANNGRLNPVIAKLIGVLGIRLVGEASEQGTIEVIHKVKGEKVALKKLFERMLERGYQGGKVCINHVFNEESAQHISQLIKQRFPQAEITISLTTALCSYYAEKGGLILGYETELV